jgi:putative membrane protein (TIGR04086 family)
MRNPARPNNHKPMHNPPSRTQGEDDSSASTFFRHVAKSLAVSLLAGAGLVFAFSLLVYFLPDPNTAIKPLALTAAALTALIGGFAAVRIHGHAALLCGLCNGMLLMGGMILASLFLGAHASGYTALQSCLLHVAFLLLSVLGSYLGLKKPSLKRKY